MANNNGTDDFHIAGVGIRGNAVVNVSGCSFINNTVSTHDSAIRVGGDEQSQNQPATATVTNCTFRGNSAACSSCTGGAIAVFDNSLGELLAAADDDI